MSFGQPQRGGVFPLAIRSKASEQPQVVLKKNPISDLLSDDVYFALEEHGLFDEKAIRDYHIRKIFKEFKQEVGTSAAIEKLQNMYPYLQYDTIRKIVYQLGAVKSGEKKD